MRLLILLLYKLNESVSVFFVISPYKLKCEIEGNRFGRLVGLYVEN